jgi:hypothetical protein
MSEALGPNTSAFEANLAGHRRLMEHLTPPEIKGPRFDVARQLVIDALHGERTAHPAVELTAANTDAQELYFQTK